MNAHPADGGTTVAAREEERASGTYIPDHLARIHEYNSFVRIQAVLARDAIKRILQRNPGLGTSETPAALFDQLVTIAQREYELVKMTERLLPMASTLNVESYTTVIAELSVASAASTRDLESANLMQSSKTLVTSDQYEVRDFSDCFAWLLTRANARAELIKSPFSDIPTERMQDPAPKPQHSHPEPVNWPAVGETIRHADLSGTLRDEVEHLQQRELAVDDRERILALADIAIQRNVVEAAHAGLDAAVAHARDAGATWSDVGRVFGTTPVAARRRWDKEARRRHSDYRRS